MLIGALLVIALFVVIGFVHRRRSRASQVEYETRRKRHATFDDHLNTIFVSVPCYKDEPECARTLFDIFNEADCPWRISAGVLHHVADEHAPNPFDASVTDAAAIMDDILGQYERLCSARNATSFAANIRVIVRPASEARGSLAARAAIEQQLFRKERFFMTIDSHTRLARSWDTALLDMYTQCFKLSPKPVLTTLPGNYQRDTSLPDDDRPTFTVVAGTDTNGFPKLRPIAYELTPVRCFPAPLFVPCFSFASSDMIREVPADALCEFLASGPATYVQSARYWTHGWDFMHPKAAVCYHLADKSYRRTSGEQIESSKDNMARQIRGVARALAALRRDQCVTCGTPRDEHTLDHGLGHDFEMTFPETGEVWRFGLGQQRTLAAFEQHCGVRVPGQIAAKARIGCCDVVSTEELLAKFGRLDVYEMLLRQTT